MAIEFFCTQCGKPLWASDGSVGQRVLCGACGQFSVVPEQQAPPQGAWAGPAKLSNPTGEGNGNPFSAPQETQWTTYRGTGDNRATIALVLGLVSLGAHVFCCGIGLPFAIAGLIVGIPAMKGENRGLAIAGVVCSSVSAAICLIPLAAIGVFFLASLAR